jgi:hypothetical protein
MVLGRARSPAAHVSIAVNPVEKPIERYLLTYADRDWVKVDVTWRAIQKPWVRAEGDLTGT